MLSKKMESALNNQITEEFFSSYLYLSMSAYFTHENLSGFANWAYVQHQEEIYHGIIDKIQEDVQNGFIRLKRVLSQAAKLTICGSNPLSSEINILDKKGICHHLANERDEIKWKK